MKDKRTDKTDKRVAGRGRATRKPAATTPTRGLGTSLKRRGSPVRRVRIRLKRILVPVDFSEASMKALGYAAGLAALQGARMDLIHVVEPMIYPPEAGFIPLDETGVVKAAKRRLGALGREAVPVGRLGRVLVVLGSPPREIAEAAGRLKSDWIVVSTHGYTGLQHVLLGSTAERVVRHAPCPVLVVRRGG